MPGSHRLHARLTDNAGAATETTVVEITVHPRDSRPIVTLVARDALAIEPSPDGLVDTATFRIGRHGSTAGELAVRYTLHGRAENGIDYQELSGRAVIPPGSTGVEVTIVPLADREAEDSESVILQIEEDPSYLTDGPQRASAVIRERSSLAEPPQPPRCIRLADGLIHICFPADSEVCFRFESSTNLRDWTTMFCLLPVDGVIHFVDERSPDFPHRYFRIAREPDGLRDE
jgi:hypothetical protein